MYKLVCVLNLFAETQHIYLIDSEASKSSIAASVALNELSERIVDISDIVKVNHIELHGAPAYATAMSEDIYTYAKAKYNNNDLIVEVL